MEKIISNLLFVFFIISISNPIYAATPDLNIEYGSKPLYSGSSIHYYSDSVTISISSGIAGFTLFISNYPPVSSVKISGSSLDLTLNNPSGPIIFQLQQNSSQDFSAKKTINFYKDVTADPNSTYTYSSKYVHVQKINNITLNPELTLTYYPDIEGVMQNDINDMFVLLNIRLPEGQKYVSGTNYTLSGYVDVMVLQNSNPVGLYRTDTGAAISGSGKANLYEYPWRHDKDHNTLQALHDKGKWEATKQFTVPPNHTGSISAALTGIASQDTVTFGQQNTLNVTLNSKGSTCIVDGKTPIPQITSRRYWASTNEADLNNDSKGSASNDETKLLSVTSVVPNSTIYCKVRVYNDLLATYGLTCIAEKTYQIHIGQTDVTGIKTVLEGELTPKAIPSKQPVTVTLKSPYPLTVATVNGGIVPITSRKYWISTKQSDLSNTEGIPDNSETYTKDIIVNPISIDNLVYCKIEVTSDAVKNAGGNPYKATAYLTLHVGKIDTDKTSNVKAVLDASATPGSIAKTKTASVTVTLNSGGSFAKINNADTEISERKYWVTTDESELSDISKSTSDLNTTFTKVLNNVSPNTTIYCKVRIESIKVFLAGFSTYIDEMVQTVQISESGAPPKILTVSCPDVYGYANIPFDFSISSNAVPPYSCYYTLNGATAAKSNGNMLQNGTIHNGNFTVNATYPQEGDYPYSVVVVNGDGSTGIGNGFGSANVHIIAPYPTASVTTSGRHKVKRVVKIDATMSFSPVTAPLDATKTEIYITPVSGSEANTNLYVVNSLVNGYPDGFMYSGSISGALTKDVTFTAAGDYDIRVVVYNSRGLSDTSTKRISIDPDIPPIADFAVPSVTIRDTPDGTGHFYAQYLLVDMSVSRDNDTIYKRIWKYRYDSNNDGNFNDESWVTLDSTNKTSLTFKTAIDGVGRYQFSLDAYEDVRT